MTDERFCEWPIERPVSEPFGPEGCLRRGRVEVGPGSGHWYCAQHAEKMRPSSGVGSWGLSENLKVLPKQPAPADGRTIP